MWSSKGQLFKKKSITIDMGIIKISAKKISNFIINLKSYYYSSRHIFSLSVNQAKVKPRLNKFKHKLQFLPFTNMG